MSSGFSTVLIAGATGYVGTRATKSFLKAPGWTVYILVSPASLQAKSDIYNEYKEAGAYLVEGTVADPSTYKDKLIGIDVVLSTLGVLATDTAQVTLARAAHEAGVKLFVPSEFGIDARNFPGNPLVALKMAASKEFEKIGITVTYIVTGPFYEYLLGWNGWGCDVSKNTIMHFEDLSAPVTAVSFEEVVELLPVIVNDPTIINNHLELGYTTTAGQILDAEITALGGKDKVTISSISRAELDQRASQPLPGALGDRLFAVVASGKCVASAPEDGSRYGKKFSTFAEYAGPYVAGLRNGTKWIWR